MNNNARMQYLKNRVETASPIGRIIILYEACIRFLEQSQEEFKKKNKIEFVEKIIRAQNIIRELRNSLNLDIDEKIGGGFYSLYNYMLKELKVAIRNKKTEPVDQVVKHLQSLYKSWKTADEKGLGRDVKSYEERASVGTLGIGRRVAAAQTYETMNQGLNLMS